LLVREAGLHPTGILTNLSATDSDCDADQQTDDNNVDVNEQNQDNVQFVNGHSDHVEQTADDHFNEIIKDPAGLTFTPLASLTAVGAAQVPETSGHDIISGPTDETFTGGAGHNTFVFAPGFGKDTITNFHLDTDVIEMTSALFSTAQAVFDATHDDANGNAVIAVGVDTITFNNITTAQLIAHHNDFHII
jgi:hypothetical protein